LSKNFDARSGQNAGAHEMWKKAEWVLGEKGEAQKFVV